jgi:hypothetical protein
MPWQHVSFFGDFRCKFLIKLMKIENITLFSVFNLFFQDLEITKGFLRYMFVKIPVTNN